jgi:hypothetical protein
MNFAIPSHLTNLTLNHNLLDPYQDSPMQSLHIIACTNLHKSRSSRAKF